MSRERFKFDDEVDDLEEDLQPYKTEKEPINNTNESLVDSTDKDPGDKSMGKVRKKRRRLKKRYAILLFLLAVAIVFVVYVFVAGGNDGPVYGDRCASLIAIDKDKFNSIEDTVKADPNINSINIEVDCRIIKISMNFVDNIISDDAKALATNALHTLDDALGQPKSEGSAYSELLGTANGRGQYNVEFVLMSSGDTNFPIFGTKHPSNDEISFTGANVVDQTATDRALKKDETQ